MTYRIKVIEYESGRKEYVPQVKKWYGWSNMIDGYTYILFSTAIEKIEEHKASFDNSNYTIKSVTYKPVQP